MQNVVVDKPYGFVPPHRGTFWMRLLRRFLPWRLRARYGVESVTVRDGEKLNASLRAGDGVLLAPNHPRLCDPEVIHEMCRQLRVLPYFMGSWHLFTGSRIQAWLLRRGGVFSIYREGTDRASLSMAIELLEKGGRPLVIFPEGLTTRTNDRLNPLMEGAPFIARGAAKKRAKRAAGGRVVVHPVALRYRFLGDVRESVEQVLTEIEQRLTWRPQTHLALEERITTLGSTLLMLKEMQYIDRPQSGTISERTAALIDALLVPLEQEWLSGHRESHATARVKALRTAVLHDMIDQELPEPERARRWRQIEDMYLAQSISFYPPDYISSRPTPERMLETVERFEEDLTDHARVHEPLAVTLTIGDAIPVSPKRVRNGEEDPLSEQLRESLESLLELGS